MSETKSLRIAMQMDPIENVDIKGDSTFRIAIEAQLRGHEVHVYQPDDLVFEDGVVSAYTRRVHLRNEVGNHVDFDETVREDLARYDVVWLRQDPPFDMHYITNTHFLERLRGETLVVNDPFWVRNFPEKLMVLNFPDLIPPTLISRNLSEIKRFRDEHRDIIVKPLYEMAVQVFSDYSRGDSNLNSLFELFTMHSREPLIAQKFLPDVSAGDKRVILVNGEPVGAINRVPASGETRSNMHVGGVAKASELTARDREICEKIGPTLRDNGQIFVGIDVIGGYLTEINVTSPTGIQELERFSGVNTAEKLWEVIEAKCQHAH